MQATSKYFVCVELHGTDNYRDLDDEMKERGFIGDIEADEGVAFRLPRGVYRVTSSDSASAIRDRAHEAAKNVASRVAIVVVRYKGSAWIGLDKVVPT